MSLNDIRPKLLHLADYVSPGESHHVGRRRVTGAFTGALHTHDFAEILWVEDGSLTHLINGESRLITAGDVVFIRPADAHTFRPVAGGFTTVSLAFPAQTLTFLRRRYFAHTEWPWSLTPRPRTHRLGPIQLRRLTDLLAADPSSRLVLERALLELLHEVAEPAGNTLPSWLLTATSRVAEDPAALVGGVPALARYAGRSREHVNRLLREHTGRTATETVNELRLSQAAKELRMTDHPIARIAADCGLGNLSHFYRLFDRRFGTTPRRYRIKHAALFQGGETPTAAGPEPATKQTR